MAAPARRMLLLHRRHVARAHDAALGLVAAAFADADAAHRRALEAAALGEEMEMGRKLGRPIVRAEAQIGRDGIGIDDLARIHPTLGIPDRLELAESFDQL